jgi:hypothetical protein
MKGGITSGIVYPNAVLALAREYRFKNIGGTSAGAIAAAASAAAAYGDRCKTVGKEPANDPAMVGFDGLQIVSKKLSRQGFIYSLFQPAWGAQNTYRLVVILAGNAGTFRKVVALLVTVLAIAPVETLLILGLLLGLGAWIGGTPGIWASLLPAVACAYLGGAIAAALRAARVARGNLLGLCSGMRRRRLIGKGRPALTEWLHEVLQALSGKDVSEPLTFRDLWDAPRYECEPATAKAMALQMITTSVSHHEPRTLPFENGRFWFRKDQFEKLFPSPVVKWLIERAGDPVTLGTDTYFRLVEGGDMPVLIGMRMSLSFPMLISAVPLHEPCDWQQPAPLSSAADATDDAVSAVDEKTLLDSTDSLTTGGGGAGKTITAFRVCWFSDGGISSNFPIHLFDAPLPVWPTFAIDLVYPKTDDSSAAGSDVWLPSSNNSGWQRTYQAIAKPKAAAELAGFLFGIIGTMQNWRDLLLSRAPGQRDRIVHIALSGDEGGMNLNMPQVVLDEIANKGTRAGEAFASFSFSNHYWIRWRNLASAVQRFTIRISDSLESKPPIAEYGDAYSTAQAGVPPPKSYPFRSSDREQAAEALLASLASKGADWEDLGPDLTTGAPRPLPQLQITPIF